MNELEGGEDTRACATAQRFDENAVAVVIIDNKDVIVAGTGCVDKFTGLVGVNLTGDGFNDGGVTRMMQAYILWVAGWERISRLRSRGVAVGNEVGWWGSDLFGRVLVFTCLIEVSFYHGDGRRRMPAKGLACKFHEMWKEPPRERCVKRGRERGGEECGVRKRNELRWSGGLDCGKTVM